MNKQTKLTHRYRQCYGGYQRGRRWGEDEEGEEGEEGLMT